jgi:transposase
MQGIKGYQEKLFINFQLSDRVPYENFYRKLKETLDLTYLRNMTKGYYGTEGQKSIDTVVFFKLMLIGYLENINSDRKIVEQAGMRIDMLYFLDYDIDEPLPWHSTLSRTRKLFGEEVFLELFRNILRKCVAKGMVNGKVQAVDSAFIKANASLDSMIEMELFEGSSKYFNTLVENEENEEREKKGTKGKRYNDKYVSPHDPDARVSQKRGKFPALNHLGIISVDAASHIICGASVDFADKRDGDTTEKIVGQTIENLQEVGIRVETVLADANYNCEGTHKYLEKEKIDAYIPVPGMYVVEREGFIYNKEEDCYTCTQGVKLPFKGIKINKAGKPESKTYRTTVSDCKNCPLKSECCKNQNIKSIFDTPSKPYLDVMYAKMNTIKGKKMRVIRSATVEPVWGTLLNYRGIRKVYTIGNKLANKQLLMAATAYNLKKLVSIICKEKTVVAVKTVTKNLKTVVSNLNNVATHLKSIILDEIFTYFKILAQFKFFKNNLVILCLY